MSPYRKLVHFPIDLNLTDKNPIANEIVQGDVGVVLDLSITDDGQPVDLTNSEIELTIKIKQYTIKKQATITSATSGKCEVVLDESDTSLIGIYSFQVKIQYLDGKKYNSKTQRYSVIKNIGLQETSPPPSTPIEVIDGGTF